MAENDIRFDPKLHRYDAVRGGEWIPIPGVSLVLSTMRPSPARFASPMKRDLGTAVHAMVENDIRRRDLGEGVDLEYIAAGMAYVQAWKRFVAECGVVVVESEQIVVHHAAWYCGRLDMVAKHREDKETRVIDLKTGADDDNHRLQVVAYCKAAFGVDWLRHQCEILYLRPTGRYALRALGVQEQIKAGMEWDAMIGEFHYRHTWEGGES